MNFQLLRQEDISGISGTGVVADGRVFPDGRVVMRWRPGRVQAPSTVFYDSLDDVLKIHGHGGKTVIRDIDDPQHKLSRILSQIEAHDANYDVRYRLVLQALGLAILVGFPAGIRIDPADPKWPVVFIELPTGQISWHMPQHRVPWDGHSTDEKYARIQAWSH